MVTDATLGFFYFILSTVIYAWKIVTSKVPMSTPQNVNKETYIYKNASNRELKFDIYYPLGKTQQEYPFI